MVAAAVAGVATILRLRAERYSYRAIAAHLDRKGVPPPRAQHWSAMTVRNVYERESKRRSASAPHGTSP